MCSTPPQGRKEKGLSAPTKYLCLIFCWWWSMIIMTMMMLTVMVMGSPPWGLRGKGSRSRRNIFVRHGPQEVLEKELERNAKTTVSLTHGCRLITNVADALPTESFLVQESHIQKCRQDFFGLKNAESVSSDPKKSFKPKHVCADWSDGRRCRNSFLAHKWNLWRAGSEVFCQAPECRLLFLSNFSPPQATNSHS